MRVRVLYDVHSKRRTQNRALLFYLLQPKNTRRRVLCHAAGGPNRAVEAARMLRPASHWIEQNPHFIWCLRNYFHNLSERNEQKIDRTLSTSGGQCWAKFHRNAERLERKPNRRLAATVLQLLPVILYAACHLYILLCPRACAVHN